MTKVTKLSDHRQIKDEVEQRVKEESEKYPPTDDGGGDEPDLGFVKKCFQSNEVGDSLLFNYLNQGKFLYILERGLWMYYVGPHWEIDRAGRCLAAIEETVVPQYLRLVKELEDEIRENAEDTKKVSDLKDRKKPILKRINKLRSVPGRKNCMTCAHSNAEPMTASLLEFDINPWLLATPNGVIDLKTGESRDGRSDDLLTKTTATEWEGIEVECPRWEKFLDEILDGKQEVISFLKRVLGYAITGLSKERIFVVLYGQHGQNGKGTVFDVLFHILGELIGPIQSEMLMGHRTPRNSSAPTPDILDLKNKRMVWGSETEEAHRFATGKVKWITGGDPLTGRGINDRTQTTFLPTHTLFLLTNRYPSAPPNDGAFWERTFVIEFPLSFVRKVDPEKSYHRQRDEDLLETLYSEAPGILAWLVQGCIEYQKAGLSPPDSVIKDTKKYRKNVDVLADFIEECCDIGAAFEDTFKELYNAYKDWWEDVAPGTRPLKKKKFGELLSDKFEKNTGGTRKYYGLKITSFRGSAS